MCTVFFFFNDTATTEIYTLSLHDALPILAGGEDYEVRYLAEKFGLTAEEVRQVIEMVGNNREARSEEHTSELQSRQYLVCRLLLEKKNDATCNKPRGALHSLDGAQRAEIA